MSKYIFVVGGVMSGVGKGVATASIGRILQNYGYKVTVIKIDPYINVDAGTMNPVEHGEVFVTEDGLESDQDLGNYERFLNIDMHRINYMTTGSVYEAVIHRERNLEYKGKCVQVIPHIPQEVVKRIERCAKSTKSDFVLIEIGGTVGEYENLVYLEAGRMMKHKSPDNVSFIMVSYVPTPAKIGEMKTKPTQHAVRIMNSAGVQPDFIIARANAPLDKPRKSKIATFCNIKEENVISAPDIESIYEVPINFEKDGLGKGILRKFGLAKKINKKKTKEWENLVKKVKQSNDKSNKNIVKIGVIGKYFLSGDGVLSDAYISVIEAVKHACWAEGVRPVMNWLDSDAYETDPKKLKEILDYDGIIVPGGFGSRGIEGKISAIGFARKKNIPFFGLCYGMQLAVVEVARNLAKMKRANTVEIDPDTKYPVINIAEEQKENMKNNSYGGSMRLGSFPCELKNGSISKKAYKETTILERHRHRYEFNNKYKDKLEKAGLVATGINRERNLVEIVELKNHPFFVGVQFHPEFKSSPLKPHPLFKSFAKACAIKR